MNEQDNKRPKRVWITWDDAYPWPTPEMGGDEYVRADLLATARKEALKEAAEKVHAMSRIDARDKSHDFLSGAAWLQNKAALMLATLSVEAATTDTDKTERG